MGHWTISRGLEPIYVDDPWDNPDYDPRDNDMDCMMCPCTRMGDVISELESAMDSLGEIIDG